MSWIAPALILSTKNFTSAPATKALPAPSRAIVVISSRAFSPSSTSPSCDTTVTFSAFIASGLLIRTVAMPPSTSTSMYEKSKGSCLSVNQSGSSKPASSA